MDVQEFLTTVGGVYGDGIGSASPVVTPRSISNDGTNGNSLSATSPASFAFNNTDTVIFGGWIKMTNRVNDGFIGQLDTVFTTAYYFGTDGNGKLDFVYWNGGSYAEVTAASALSNNTAYFIIGWYNPSLLTVNIKVNAGTAESADASSGAGAFTFTPGNLYLANDGSDGIILQGLLDEFFVCKNPANLATALSTIASDVYNGGTGARYSTLSSVTKTAIGLQNWWGMDESSGSRLDLHGSVNLTANGTVAAGTALVS